MKCETRTNSGLTKRCPSGPDTRRVRTVRSRPFGLVGVFVSFNRGTVETVRLPAKAGLHDEIVRVSIQLGSELGEEGVTMRAIASRLGVSATALYQHFESKAAILREIRFLGVRTLLEAQEPATHVDDPVERIHALAKHYIDFAVENRWLYKVLFYEDEVDWSDLNADEREHLAAPLKAARSACEAGVAAGVFRSDIDLDASALLLWASVHGLASLLINGRISENHPSFPVGSRDEFVRTMVEGVLRSFRVPGAVAARVPEPAPTQSA